MFGFLFLAPYGRKTRYEEVVRHVMKRLSFSLENQEKNGSLCSRASLWLYALGIEGGWSFISTKCLSYVLQVGLPCSPPSWPVSSGSRKAVLSRSLQSERLSCLQVLFSGLMRLLFNFDITGSHYVVHALGLPHDDCCFLVVSHCLNDVLSFRFVVFL